MARQGHRGNRIDQDGERWFASIRSISVPLRSIADRRRQQGPQEARLETEDEFGRTGQANGGSAICAIARREAGQWQERRLISEVNVSLSPVTGEWSAARWCAGLLPKGVELLTFRAARSICAIRRRSWSWVVKEAVAGRFFPRRNRRHRRQQHAAGRIHLRQPDPRRQRGPGRASERRREADVSGGVLHRIEAAAQPLREDSI